MKSHITLQERLKDLRTEKGLTLKELEAKTGISSSALGDVITYIPIPPNSHSLLSTIQFQIYNPSLNTFLFIIGE